MNKNAADVLDRFSRIAEQKDAADPLARFRDRFYVRPGVVYLDGNSLGLLSKDAEAATLTVLRQWRDLAVEGWSEADPPWVSMAERLGDFQGQTIGAEAGSVVVTGSTTLNLHQLLATLYRPTQGRWRVLCDPYNFPSDLYAVQSHLRLRGFEPKEALRYAPATDEFFLDEQAILDAMDETIALAVLPSVLFTSGQRLDMERLTRGAKEKGVMIGFDLAHSIGLMPHDLDKWAVDFAFWCNYKYMNSGPGAVGGLYLNRKHWGESPGLAGWFSNRKETQFEMRMELDPAETAAALQIGTPPMLSMAPLQGALAITLEAGVEAIRTKSLALTSFLLELISATIPDCRFANPMEEARRGGQVCFRHPEARLLSISLRKARRHRGLSAPRHSSHGSRAALRFVRRSGDCRQDAGQSARNRGLPRRDGQGRSHVMVYDITHPLEPTLAMWPGDTPYRLEAVAKLSEGDSVNLGAVGMSLHAGTHADAPYHYSQNGATIEQVELDAYIGPAQLIDVTGESSITVEVLDRQGIGSAPRLLLRTSAWLDTRIFPESIPTLTESAVDYLLEKGIILLGLDVPSVDDLDSKTLPIHHALGRAKIRIIESLRLRDVPEGIYELIALPLRIVGGDGSPIRAVLRG